MWHRSTDQADVVVPPAQPGFDAAPPQAPAAPPTTKAARRRFGFLIAGLVILVIVALVAALVVSRSDRVKPNPAPNAIADVRQTFLNYYAAIELESKQLDSGPVRPFLTDAGAKQDQAILADVLKTGHRYHLTTDHDLQIVVYAGQALASVDDIMVRQTLPLDRTTLAPAGKVVVDTVEESFVLVRQGGKWLIDSVVSFGSATPDTDQRVSFVAASRGKALDAGLGDQIEQAFRGYWDADATALRTLDVTPLRGVEVEPLLSQDLSLLQKLQREGRGYQLQVQHNFRIAQEDASTFWVYDSFADSSFHVDFSTKRQVDRIPEEVTREAYKFQRADGTWKIVYDIQYT